MNRSNSPSDAIHLPEGATLTLSSKAPPLSFSTKGADLQFDASFSYANLRFDTPEGKTAVRRQKDGEGFYYRPHWPGFTVLLDCEDKQAVSVGKSLARLPVDSTAPELGIPTLPVFSLLGKQVSRATYRANDKVSLIWNSDLPLLAYLGNLQPEAHRKLLEEHGSTLLEHCLLTRRFLGAEMLWEAGVRLSEQSLEKGTALWGLCEQSFEATPTVEMTLSTMSLGSLEKRLQSLLGPPADIFAPWTDKDTKPLPSDRTRKLMTFFQTADRWLERLVEAGINVNATLEFNYQYTDGSKNVVRKRVLEAVFESFEEGLGDQALAARKLIGNEKITPPEAMLYRWCQHMDKGGFDWQSPPAQDERSPANPSFIDWAQSMTSCQKVVALVRRAALDQQLVPVNVVQRKTRF